MTIKEMRNIKETRGYSYSKLSEYTGIPAITIQKIFTGRTKNPRRATLDALERVLGGDEGFFIGKALSYERSGLTSDEDRDNRYLLKEDSAYYMEKQDGEYTLDDYYALPEERRVELIDGVFYDMSTPRFVHQDIVNIVNNTIYNYIKKNKGRCKVIGSPSDVQLDCDNKTMLQPDVYVICDRDKIKGFGIYGSPDFVLEVLSPSTRKKDMTIKLNKYWSAGVREYWIIDPKKRSLITYDFTEEDVIPVIRPLTGMAPVAIFDGKLEIDLDEINEAIDEFGDLPS